ncbi:MAG: hypothetical protein L6R39_002318 [Caloplaca ligustica]|nr:MAG: hypothetical protein L6R39_002318 [Caloplaca ligustica]
MENRATLSIPSANATVEDMIKLDREFYQHQQPPFVVQRQNKIPRVALLCNKQGRYTEQEVSIEMRDWDGGNRVYPVALVAGEERVLQSCKGGPGGCFFRLWLGHQRGLSDQVFARPKIPPSHGGQRSKMKHAIDSTDEDSDTTYGTGKEKSTPKGNIPTKRIRPVTRTTPSVQGVSRTVQHACETCNRVKAKCDRVVPSCGTCQNAQRECDYGDSSRERETRNDDAVAGAPPTLNDSIPKIATPIHLDVSQQVAAENTHIHAAFDVFRARHSDKNINRQRAHLLECAAYINAVNEPSHPTRPSANPEEVDPATQHLQPGSDMSTPPVQIRPVDSPFREALLRSKFDALVRLEESRSLSFQQEPVNTNELTE